MKKSWIILIILGITGIIGGMLGFLWPFLKPVEKLPELSFPQVPSMKAGGSIYNNLTGEIIGDASINSAPIYCVQTPNGTDGARPQVGLDKAGIIFEAIAEAGITRFAAIYQNPTSAVIGPIRSLRIYYLEWDTPFDCTIVHAGGSGDALAAVSRGGYKDLTENYSYMYRGKSGVRRWNNLFTTSEALARMSSDRGYGGSSPKTFLRVTPTEAEKNRINDLAVNPLKIAAPAEGNASELKAKVSAINLRFGGVPSFNVHYDYDINTNTYRRSYASGAAHEIYSCPDGDLGQKNPENICSLTVLSPKVVIAMMVSEKRASDNYHEDITAIGSGKAYVFQNGTVIEGTWSKASREEQIKFLDTAGNEISLVPGQTIISAVPNYGGVEF